MKPLALPKLPDRNPVKRTIICEPELNKALEEYALLYRQTYGEVEPIETLVPFMLSAFLARDRAFAAFRKTRTIQADSQQNSVSVDQRRRKRGTSSARSDGISSSS